jgi:hypothetical protein
MLCITFQKMQHNPIEFSSSLVHSGSQEGQAISRLGITDRKMMLIALRSEIPRSEEARYAHRLHGVLLVSQGPSCYEFGEVCGQDPTTLQRWVRRFETSGVSGLQDQERPGWPQRLTPA